MGCQKIQLFMEMKETVLFQSTNHIMLTRIQMKRTMPLSIQVSAETVNNPNNQQPNLLESDAEERNLEVSGQLTSSLSSQPTDASRKLTSNWF